MRKKHLLRLRIRLLIKLKKLYNKSENAVGIIVVLLMIIRQHKSILYQEDGTTLR